jgi:hypothetical protein
MIKNDQSSSVVYGLFLEDDEATVLLGIYFLEGEAEAAREHWIELEVTQFPSRQHDWARRHYNTAVFITKLPVGQTPSFNFTK